MDKLATDTQVIALLREENKRLEERNQELQEDTNVLIKRIEELDAILSPKIPKR